MTDADTKESGCWAAYAYDYGAYLISVHPTEVEAWRAASAGYGHVTWLPWGLSLADAIKASETRPIESLKVTGETGG